MSGIAVVAESSIGTRQRIVESALQLIAENGVGGVTMTAVADKAEVARQTLYNHFPDVESIVTETIETHQVESFGMLRSVLATIQSPMARLEHLVRHFAAVSVHHPPVVDLQHGLSARAQLALQKHDSAVLRLIEDTLTAGVDGGEFRTDLQVDLDAQLVKRMLDGVAEYVASDPATVLDAVGTGIRTVLAAVTAQPIHE